MSMASPEPKKFTDSTQPIAFGAKSTTQPPVDYVDVDIDSPKAFALKVKKETEELHSNTSAISENFKADSVSVIVNKHMQNQKQKQNVDYSLIIQEWEGCITEVKDDVFLAQLIKKGADSANSIELEFDKADVPEDEQHLIVEGMVFYWINGKEIKKSGNMSYSDYIIFRRIPSWKNFDINSQSDKTNAMFSFLSGSDP